MLDTATKRRIDTARDILVGKVPDPKSQVEQITIALIYKFMDDMDAEAEELGGRRTFFAHEFGKYGWAKLMRSGLGGHETLGLYAEAITRMPENPGIPALFRDIFKNAYLPYRDPETLRAFLKIIDEFEYDHSERLGDAFEYLLSVLGSQGDAGQFRTPRHIIDFIVDIVDPKKGDTILDPACGTAGFLISAWKHILDANRDAQGESTLTPDDRERLAAGIRGYDISPDMVRLSLANMYLHGFADPHIAEYDTLTSDERWNEFADVILANPPFMSPKGGIKPHNRFGVQSNRSEVLFVDYMAEHLTPNGRAGIIVPEGVIFQSGKSYKALRKMLVEKYLVAVISLPAGVFNPYSGVKTSILILDSAGAKASKTIGFFKVTNDGFALGAQRRETGGSELAEILAEIVDYRAHSSEEVWEGRFGRAVAKAEIAASGQHNLSGERYRSGPARLAHFPHAHLRDVAEIASGNPAPQGDANFAGGTEPFIRTSDVGRVHLSDRFVGTADQLTTKAAKNHRMRLFPKGTILFPKSGASTFLNHRVVMGEPAYVSSHLACIICNEGKLIPQFAYRLLCSVDARDMTPDQAYPSLRTSEIGAIEVPLPPLEVQQEIVAETEGYQKVIDGARVVVENYRPHIVVGPKWSVVTLGGLADNLDARRVPITKGDRKSGPYPYYGASGIVDWVEGYLFDENLLLISEDGANLIARSTPIAFSIVGKTWVNNHAHVLRFDQRATQAYVETYLNNISLAEYVTGSAQPKLNQESLNRIEIPLPPLETQREIAAELEAERALVEANRELITRMEKKIEAAIARIWSAAETAGPEQLAAE
ncbi:MAG: type restriction enzyme protein [Sphingomonadales bacterium]|jgi:type I restriction enzyme M protein|nr:type restriction enzyme protein [Sphingomonadales bacterium]